MASSPPPGGAEGLVFDCGAARPVPAGRGLDGERETGRLPAASLEEGFPIWPGMETNYKSIPPPETGCKLILRTETPPARALISDPPSPPPVGPPGPPGMAVARALGVRRNRAQASTQFRALVPSS